MAVSQADRHILRELAKQINDIGHLPVQQKTADLWRRLNRLEPVRPLVWINEIPWHEMGDEAAIQTTDPFCQDIEIQLRRTLYQWQHMPADMVVDPILYTPYVYHNSGYGIETHAVRPVEDHGAADYVPIIKTERDIDKIQIPTITADWEATERLHQATAEMLGDILSIEKRGIVRVWCAPWDILIQWWGIEELYVDMVDRPAFVHKGISRMMDVLVAELDQYEQLGLLSTSNGNHRVGSGGLGITDELPPADFDPSHVRPRDQWGMSTGQIFSEVSPDMFDEFCLHYEKRYMERFGLIAYGCCEPLHKKMHLVRTIPSLRRVSMSPWIDVDEAVANVGGDFIFSYKPNPAVLATDTWNPHAARAELRDVLEKARGCRVELIMKDITTVRNEPHRLWEWTDIAMEAADALASQQT